MPGLGKVRILFAKVAVVEDCAVKLHQACRSSFATNEYLLVVETYSRNDAAAVSFSPSVGLPVSV